jgi:branched-chain amino acid transport system permease protein
MKSRGAESAVTSQVTTTLAPAETGARRRALDLRKCIALGALVILAIALPAVLTSYWLFLTTQVIIYAVATLGLDILFGRTGQLSMAHASFMGLGAYVTVVAAQNGVAPIGQFALVIIVSFVAGAVVAIPTLRLSGLRLALVTLLFGELFTWFINNTTELTGGSQGANADPLVIGSFDTSLALDGYLLALAFGVIATLATIQLARTQLGRRMLAVRDSELAAQSAGVNVVRTKIVSFMMAALFAGIAGWLYAYIVGFISPTTFDLFPSVYFMVAVLLGGAGTVLGAWLGAAYIVLVPQVFTIIGYPNLFPILGGAVLVVVALLLPDGLVSAGARIGGLVTRRGEGGSAATPSVEARSQ